MTQSCRALASALVLGLTLSAAGAEPAGWAAQGLPVQEGLIFWLDASQQVAAWQAHAKPTLVHGAALDTWYDGSGNDFHLVQRVRDGQPRFLAVGERAVVRFDGEDDFLGLEPGRRSVDRFTVFVVAAPHTDAGDYRGFISAYETGHNDYTTGFTIDLDQPASEHLEQINVEGKGFGGAVNLLNQTLALGEFHTIEVTCDSGKESVRLVIDERPAGSRDRQPGTMQLDGLLIGARCYSNSAEPPAAGGFLDGDIAEVLFYDRILDDNERSKVRSYLQEKHAGLSAEVAVQDGRGGRRHQPMENPPLVQMLVPGFSIHELPLELTNLNNVRYRSDGKLVALGYDGNIHLLSDTDGDGLEDHAERFWDNQGRLRGPIGIALTPLGYRHATAMPSGGFGIFVASKGKLSLIVDADGDDRAEREVIVASGWDEIPQNVDALGVALAADGSVYFALGTANFANGYLLDEHGRAQYDLASERGTVLRVSPDFSQREIVCTGVRFPVALAFNRHGDLFCTDQEGATWLPNGNPFDELLHIQPGRHYGFPPRHPRHLPAVIDEPSVFDYGPQHQSTCGLVFNEAVQGGPVFGPQWWAHDALVCGESRGRLFRTKLARTTAGYVALNQTIACLGMLTVDACVSPAGDLIVACHSGPPDWGTGPVGTGKLFRIRYADRDRPQPVLAWAAGPREVRISFDRPLDPTQLQDIVRRSAIEFGQNVRAGDEFEILQPPYAVVQRQTATLRYDLPVLAAQITADRRTLVLATAPHTTPTWHAIKLPASPATLNDGISQLPTMQLDYDLSGVEASWKATAGDAHWSGWLPHIDLSVARELTTGSGEHDSLWQALNTAGQLKLRTQLDLQQMLQPAVQVGAALDYGPSPETVTVSIRSSHALEVTRPAAGSVTPAADGFYYEMTVTPEQGQWLPLELAVATSSERPTLEISFSTAEDSRVRALPVRRFRLPWTSPTPQSHEQITERRIPELEGGDWVRGRQIFLSEAAACSKCHSLRGQGGRIGPDLSNLPQRSYDAVLRDIVQPNAMINPDHLNYTVVLNEGRVLSGVILSSQDQMLVLGDSTGKEITISRAEIEALEPSPISNMPSDLGQKLPPGELRDLLTFLMTEPLQPAPLERRDAPPPRRFAELEPLLKDLEAPAATPGPLHIVLVDGPKDHGPDEHDYPLWQGRWSRLLGFADQVEVSQASAWPSREQLEAADVIVFNSANPAWNADKAAELDQFLARGGGLVYLHFATNGGQAVDQLAERIGLATDPAGIRWRHGPLDLSFVDPQHPITRGFDGAHGLESLHFVDESYWRMTGDPEQIHVLATAIEDGQPRPLMWAREHGGGRIFVSILGHYTWTYDDPFFRLLVLRGMSWTARQPVDRLSELITIGARVE